MLPVQTYWRLDDIFPFHIPWVASPLSPAVTWHAITICIRAGYSFSCTHGRDTCSCVSPICLMPRHNQAHPSFRVPDQVTAGILLLAYMLRDENTCMKHTVFVDMDNQQET